ncbi:MAG TPA: DUF1697 domain-containing protein [Actinophytocola sp.]|jgi:uncharacterized protein (DUF1697 family)|uniref:DUF1697 domain-containing protein n=1 Tax=Actinophytocola sp. TaxID=1872138 RepID=UPI002E003C14|nr:DUF1697 domain-containing protein [Actinophytocola sp.]
MTRYVALLRGINVGGRAKVPMAGLRATCESVGCTDVLTYIQSGNVALTSPLDPARLRATLEAAIAEQLGVAPVVVIRTHRQLADVVAANPFPTDPENVHVAFLAEALDKDQSAAAAGLERPHEEIAARGTEVYFHLPNGMGRAKLPELFGRRVKTPATVRNWRTVNKLVEMSAS